jgi:hypothetical protein
MAHPGSLSRDGEELESEPLDALDETGLVPLQDTT